MDGFNLHFIKEELSKILLGGRVSKISLPFSDMLILQLRNNGENFRLLFAVNPQSTRLHISEKSFENPMEAPATLMLFRKYLSGTELKNILQPNGDRVLIFEFDGLSELGDKQKLYLYFEATGKHTNLTLVLNDRIIDCLRHISPSMSRLRIMFPGSNFVYPPIQDKMDIFAFSREDIEKNYDFKEPRLSKALQNSFCGISNKSLDEICFRLCGEYEGENFKASNEAFNSIKSVIEGLSFEPRLYYYKSGDISRVLPYESRLKTDETFEKAKSFSHAIELMYHSRDFKDRMNQSALSLIKSLKQARQRAENRALNAEENIISDERIEKLRISGELITAYMSKIPKGAKSVKLFNYYTGSDDEILLDETKSPQQNAQGYFKQYKKALTAKKLAAEQIEKAREDIRILDEGLYYISIAKTGDEISEVRESLELKGLIRKKSDKRRKKTAESKPLCFELEDGTRIFVGKNSYQNERLLKQAGSDDLWLHAKDVPGSHVIIRGEQNEFSVNFALMLAAFYSKAEGRSVDVDYTKRCYVKKISGAGEGRVSFTNNKSERINVSLLEIDKIIKDKNIRSI